MKLNQKYATAVLLVALTFVPTVAASATQPSASTVDPAGYTAQTTIEAQMYVFDVVPSTLQTALYEQYIWSKATATQQSSPTALSAARAASAAATLTASASVKDLIVRAALFQAKFKKLVSKYTATYGSKAHIDSRGNGYGSPILVADSTLTPCPGLTGAAVGTKLPFASCSVLLNGLAKLIATSPPRQETNKAYALEAANTGRAIVTQAHATFALANGGRLPTKASSKQIAKELATAKSAYRGPEMIAIIPTGVAVTIGGQVVVTSW